MPTLRKITPAIKSRPQVAKFLGEDIQQDTKTFVFQWMKKNPGQRLHIPKARIMFVPAKAFNLLLEKPAIVPNSPRNTFSFSNPYY
jgi:hypothetical protein